MRYKSDVSLDILAVVAYGPPAVLNYAGQILLHYFPLKNIGKIICAKQITDTPGFKPFTRNSLG